MFFIMCRVEFLSVHVLFNFEKKNGEKKTFGSAIFLEVRAVILKKCRTLITKLKRSSPMLLSKFDFKRHTISNKRKYK